MTLLIVIVRIGNSISRILEVILGVLLGALRFGVLCDSKLISYSDLDAHRKTPTVDDGFVLLF